MTATEAEFPKGIFVTFYQCSQRKCGVIEGGHVYLRAHIAFCFKILHTYFGRLFIGVLVPQDGHHQRRHSYIGEVEAAPSTGFKGPPPRGATVSMSNGRHYQGH